ncbi:hypothetical protein CB1_001360005 [Camelus ferus]|nr:hypothetical protein CB1_001360005 [Camelus ferus]
MCPPRSLFLMATLVFLIHLDHLSLARSLPTTTAGPGMFQCLSHSQNLLRAVSDTLQKTLCLSSIYEDLKMYHMEFQAMNAKLLMDPKRQIFLDQNMLVAIAELMQALNVSSETVPQKPSLEEPDFYKTKIKLCILLHAFRIRAVTIDRMMSYLNSS